VTISPTLYWQQSLQTPIYLVELSEGESDHVIKLDTVFAVRRLVLSNLKAKTTYFWRVSPLDSTGILAWSAQWQFTTGTGKPKEARLIFPGDSTKDNPYRGLDFFWTEDTLATQFELQLAQVEDFSTGVRTYTSQSSHVTIPELLEHTQYFWRVRATNKEGSTLWSPVWTFWTSSSAGVARVIEKELHLALYPNPSTILSNLRFTLQEGSEMSLFLTDNLGKSVYKAHYNYLSSGDHAQLLPTAELEPGVYCLTVMVANTVIHKKLAVQH